MRYCKRGWRKAEEARDHPIPKRFCVVLGFSALVDDCRPGVTLAFVGNDFGKEQLGAMMRETVVLSLPAVAIHVELSEAAHFPCGDS